MSGEYEQNVRILGKAQGSNGVDEEIPSAFDDAFHSGDNELNERAGSERMAPDARSARTAQARHTMGISGNTTRFPASPLSMEHSPGAMDRAPTLAELKERLLRERLEYTATPHNNTPSIIGSIFQELKHYLYILLAVASSFIFLAFMTKRRNKRRQTAQEETIQETQSYPSHWDD